MRRDQQANTLNEEIGNRIRELRVEAGLTQFELACRLGYQDRSTISRIECGVMTLNTDTLYKLSVLFDCPISALVDERCYEAYKGLRTDEDRARVELDARLKAKERQDQEFMNEMMSLISSYSKGKNKVCSASSE